MDASLFFLFLFGSIVWIVYLVASAIRTRQQMRLSSEFHAKLLDKIGSARELGELLNSEGGRGLLDTLVIDAPAPHQRILRAAQTGTILVTAGIGMWIALIPGGRDWPHRVDSAVFLIAAVVVSIGAGLLLSAKVAHSISKKLGLLDPPAPPRATAIQ